ADHRCPRMPLRTASVGPRVVHGAVGQSEPAHPELETELAGSDEGLVSDIVVGVKGVSVEKEIARDRAASRSRRHRDLEWAVDRQPGMPEMPADARLKSNLGVCG